MRFRQLPSLLVAALAWTSVLVLLAGCGAGEQEREQRQAERAPTQPALFERLPIERTGVDFQNPLVSHPSPHRNELLYEYFSNGGGVAIGDVNGDGLDDLYFSGSMTYNRLYLNRGGLRFEDVTDLAGVGGRPDTWKTGVTMADVNGDGLLDIYAGYSGDLPLDRRIDELYINQGVEDDEVPRFEEQAEAYGLANPHSTNQAYFFDHDRDGDLDLFLLTHNVRRTPAQDPATTRREVMKDDPVSGNRFYENVGGRFADVTAQVGIRSSALTYGLGAGLADFDKDGWMDLYVGNDYNPPDYLYLNRGDGTFADSLGGQMGHTSYASMGIDASDVNNDGWADLVVLDMLAEDNRRQKLLLGFDDPEIFAATVASGFHHQHMRNTLQLNNGNGTFSEVGQLAGISNTDWSWSPLVADFDNDGWKDLYVTNGTLHDISDRDFLDYRARYLVQKNYDLEPADVAHLLERLPSTDVANYAFKNGGGLRFEDVSDAWGLGEPLKSTGAAFSDLDGDGDLDLVTNNLNDYASVYENKTDVEANRYLQVDLDGADQNTYGIGAKVTVWAGGAMQYAEQVPMKGYLSTVSPTLHFGLGPHAQADSVQVRWPDGTGQTLLDVQAGQRIVLEQALATDVGGRPPPPVPVFEEVPSPVGFEHRTSGADDFARQPLMTNPKSFSGPVLAQADVNGDGLADVFAGGGSGQAGQLYLQQQSGDFAPTSPPAFEEDKRSADADALFFDADGDGHLDLYVASGGYDRFAPGDAALQDRLYLGDGEGGFTKRTSALPEMRTSTGAVATTDVDGDGRPDLFVGGRVVPGRYPEPPRSYILINEGDGRFVDRTSEWAPELAQIGMVTDAAWHDLGGDGRDELVVVGEWMPITVFERADGRLADRTERYFERPYSGLWNALLLSDLDGDGTPDLLAGNLGLNTQLEASEDEPATLHYADLRGNGSVVPVLSFSIEGARYPYVTLDEWRDQAPAIAARFASHTAYAEAELGDVLTERELEGAQRLEVNTLETALFIGGQDGRFEKKELPIQAQFSPVFALGALDATGDGQTDVVLGGNVSEARIRFGKYDANYGVLLEGDGAGAFAYVPQRLSGLRLRGDVRSALVVGDKLLFGVNRGAVQAYRFEPTSVPQASAR